MKLTPISAKIGDISFELPKVQVISYEPPLKPTKESIQKIINEKFPDKNYTVMEIVSGIRTVDVYVKILD